ncbi:MAG TPA: DUF4390 domain-containing protein [Polyangia bacterium]|jgi:hypothetical protein|nr:DUF4390 domain-containing protein [Polyangia bacterium]
MSRAAFAVCLALWLMSAAGAARAQNGPPLERRTTGLHRQDGVLAASVGLQDLFGAAERQRLTSGFAARVLIRVYLHREGSPEPVAVTFQRSEIVYDIWDERFRLRITRGAGASMEFRREVKTAEEAIGDTTTFWKFPITELRRLQPGARYFLAFRADLNPISEELLSDVRRWLVQPARGQRRVGAGDSVFGSFVSIFVNPRIEDSERQVRFLSQTFVEPVR